MLRTFIPYKFTDRKIAERGFTQSMTCLVQLDIRMICKNVRPVLSLIRVLKWEVL